MVPVRNPPGPGWRHGGQGLAGAVRPLLPADPRPGPVGHAVACPQGPRAPGFPQSRQAHRPSSARASPVGPVGLLGSARRPGPDSRPQAQPPHLSPQPPGRPGPQAQQRRRVSDRNHAINSRNSRARALARSRAWRCGKKRARFAGDPSSGNWVPHEGRGGRSLMAERRLKRPHDPLQLCRTGWQEHHLKCHPHISSAHQRGDFRLVLLTEIGN